MDRGSQVEGAHELVHICNAVDTASEAWIVEAYETVDEELAAAERRIAIVRDLLAAEREKQKPIRGES